MKSYILFLSITFISFAVQGQVKIGILAGPQVTTARYSIQDAKQSTKRKFGFQLGMNCKVPFDNNLYFAPQIFYSLKGYKASFTQYSYPPDVTAVDNNTTIHTLELAALLEVDFSNKPNHWFFRGGPSLDFQIFGREKFHLLNGNLVNRKMKYGFAEYGNYAANAMAQIGYEDARGFTVYLNYGFGLTNISNVDDGPNIRHRVIGISIGQYFHPKKNK
ncbi:MAG: PorT family protein [Bacteroidetes bacterium]|nr:PorT family protein [Bacteroidota bacterium]MBS1930410.1 PorT family protein [Bacteroidota bacterium]